MGGFGIPEGLTEMIDAQLREAGIAPVTEKPFDSGFGAQGAQDSEASPTTVEAKNLSTAEEEIKKRAPSDKSGGAMKLNTPDTTLAKQSLLGV